MKAQRPSLFAENPLWGLILCLITLVVPSSVFGQRIDVLKHCDPGSVALHSFSGNGCHQVTSPGPSFLHLPPGKQATLYPTGDCSGPLSRTVTDPTFNFCRHAYADGSRINDNVRSVRIEEVASGEQVPLSKQVRVLKHCDATSEMLHGFSGEGCRQVTRHGASFLHLPSDKQATLYPTGDCSGPLSRTVTDPTFNFCRHAYADGSRINDNVRSVRIAPRVQPSGSHITPRSVTPVVSEIYKTDRIEVMFSGYPWMLTLTARLNYLNEQPRVSFDVLAERGDSEFHFEAEDVPITSGTNAIELQQVSDTGWLPPMTFELLFSDERPVETLQMRQFRWQTVELSQLIARPVLWGVPVNLEGVGYYRGSTQSFGSQRIRPDIFVFPGVGERREMEVFLVQNRDVGHASVADDGTYAVTGSGLRGTLDEDSGQIRLILENGSEVHTQTLTTQLSEVPFGLYTISRVQAIRGDGPALLPSVMVDGWRATVTYIDQESGVSYEAEVPVTGGVARGKARSSRDPSTVIDFRAGWGHDGRMMLFQTRVSRGVEIPYHPASGSPVSDEVLAGSYSTPPIDVQSCGTDLQANIDVQRVDRLSKRFLGEDHTGAFEWQTTVTWMAAQMVLSTQIFSGPSPFHGECAPSAQCRPFSCALELMPRSTSGHLPPRLAFAYEDEEGGYEEVALIERQTETLEYCTGATRTRQGQVLTPIVDLRVGARSTLEVRYKGAQDVEGGGGGEGGEGVHECVAEPIALGLVEQGNAWGTAECNDGSRIEFMASLGTADDLELREQTWIRPNGQRESLEPVNGRQVRRADRLNGEEAEEGLYQPSLTQQSANQGLGFRSQIRGGVGVSPLTWIHDRLLAAGRDATVVLWYNEIHRIDRESAQLGRQLKTEAITVPVAHGSFYGKDGNFNRVQGCISERGVELWAEVYNGPSEPADRWSFDTLPAYLGNPTLPHENAAPGPPGWAYLGDDQGGTNPYGLEVECPEAGFCFMVSDLVVVSRDEGESWAELNTGSSLNKWISCPSAQACYTLDNDGKLAATSDGGSSWQRLPSSFTAWSQELTCPERGTCYVADDNKIYRTENDGRQWDQEPLADEFSGELKSIFCADALICYATATGGTLLRRVEDAQGGSWIPSFLRDHDGNALSASLHNGTCADRYNCYVVGSHGVILKRGGRNPDWHLQDSGVSHGLNDISCVSPEACYAVGYKGTVVRTLDGGSHWQSEAVDASIGSRPLLTSVACIDSETCMASGPYVGISRSSHEFTRAPAARIWVTRPIVADKERRRFNDYYDLSVEQWSTDDGPTFDVRLMGDPRLGEDYGEKDLPLRRDAASGLPGFRTLSFRGLFVDLDHSGVADHPVVIHSKNQRRYHPPLIPAVASYPILWMTEQEGGPEIHSASFNTESRAKEELGRLLLDPNVLAAEMDQMVLAASLNDPHYPAEALRHLQVCCGQTDTWNHHPRIVFVPVRGRNIKIAVIDTGVEQNHPDLDWTKLEAKSVVRVAQPVFGGLPLGHGVGGDSGDGTGHGTRMIGIIGAIPNNQIQSAGVAPQAHIVSIRAAVRNTFQTTDLARAVSMAIEDPAVNIISMSLGGSNWGEQESSVLIRLVDRARQQGILVVAAAGNQGEKSVQFPANLPGVFRVGATAAGGDRPRSLAGFSNDGPLVDVVAPGDRIATLDVGSSIGQTTSGTSEATAFVSGVAALAMESYGIDRGCSRFNGDRLQCVDWIESNLKFKTDVFIPSRDGSVSFPAVRAAAMISNQQELAYRFDAPRVTAKDYHQESSIQRDQIQVHWSLTIDPPLPTGFSLVGYRIYRNGLKIHDQRGDAAWYVDGNTLPKGDSIKRHRYKVAAVYQFQLQGHPPVYFEAASRSSAEVVCFDGATVGKTCRIFRPNS